jgi:integrase
VTWTAKRVRVERGLYRVDNVYWACATPRGERTARWLKLGPVGVQEARRLRDEFAYAVRSGHVAQPPGRTTVRQAAEQWQAYLEELERNGEIRPRTVSSYKDGVRLHVLPQLGTRQIGSIDADDLVAWHERQRRSGAAAWSIRARWIAIRSLLAYSARIGLVTTNPCDLLVQRERPKPGRRKERFLTSEEIKALLHAADGVASLIVPMLVFSGVRAAELLGLTWGDADFDQQVIRVRHQMGRQGERALLKTPAARRDVVLMDGLAHRLRRHRLAARFSDNNDLIIGNTKGKTLGYTAMRRAFAATTSAANLSDVTPHTCRHTFASILIDQGADVEFVSDQLGHASTKTTWDIYVHLFRAREHAEAARRDLDAAFGPMLRAADELRPQS